MASDGLTEHAIQKAFFEAIHLSPLDPYVFAIPNGGKRHIGVALKLKKEGVKSGVWDTFISIPTRFYHGFYIEFKVPGGKLTDNQAAFAHSMTDKGYLCHVYTDASEACEAAKLYQEDKLLNRLQWLSYVKKKRDKKNVKPISTA